MSISRSLIYLCQTALVVVTLVIGGRSTLAHDGLNHSDLPWPPVPRGITNVIDHSKPLERISREKKRDERFKKLEALARENPSIDNFLGADVTRHGMVQEANDDKFKDRVRLRFFSRKKHATIEIVFDGDKYQEYKIIPDTEYQPELTDEEISEAIGLARNYFVSTGSPWVLDLKGYGILAYKPTGKGFYRGRVVYVSFHHDDDSPPQVSAWVDLTQQKILKIRKEQP